MFQHLRLIAIFVVVLGGGYWGYLQLFSEDIELPGLVVLEVEGIAELIRGEEKETLEVGTVLSENDRLQVGSGGRAVLGIEGTRLDVGADSALRILGVGADGIRLELEHGRIQAKVQPGNPEVEIAHGSRSAAIAQGAFSMSVSESHEILVRSEDGKVSLTGFEDMEELPAGHYVHSSPGQPIISASEAQALLLHIQWPGESLRSDSVIELQGSTLPNARVDAQHGEEKVQIQADAEGNFQVELQLLEGENHVQITAVDLLGRSTEDQMSFTVDSTPPSAVETEVQWPD